MQFVSARATLGNGVFLHREVCIYGSTQVGEDSKVGAYTVLGHPVRKNLIMSKTEAELDELSAGSRVGRACVIRSQNVIYEGVALSDSVETGHYVLVRENTAVGPNTKIGTSTIIDGGVTVGASVSIQSGVYLPPGSVVEDDVFLGPYVTVTNDLYPPSSYISGVRIGRGSVVGARAVFIAGVSVGKRAVVAAGSVVTRDVGDEEFVMGVPAKKIGTRHTYEEKKLKHAERATRTRV